MAILGDTIGSTLSWLFPRGTRRNWCAALLADSFRHPKGIPSTLRGLFSRQKIDASLRMPRSRSGTPLLFIEDVLPDPRTGSGAPRTCQIIEALVECGFKVTFFPVLRRQVGVASVGNFAEKGVEVLVAKSRVDEPILVNLLRSRKNYYGVVIISRPPNMKALSRAVRRFQKSATIIYDAEAIFVMRRINYQKLLGRPLIAHGEKRLIAREVALARTANAVLTVSEADAEYFRNGGCARVSVVRHAVRIAPTPASFAQRSGILFVGPVLDSPTPNEDAVLYFVNEVLPLIHRELDVNITIAGHIRSERVLACRSDKVRLAGSVEDLAPLYNAHRLFVAPTRYSAGVPLKVYEAAANGLPCVATPLLCSQLGWEPHKELLCGATPEEFANACIRLYSDPELWRWIRENSLERVRTECDYGNFLKQLRNAVRDSSVNETSRAGTLN